MDEEWAAGVLEWWIDKAPGALSNGAYGIAVSWGRANTPRMDELREREHQTSEVVGRVMDSKPPVLLGIGPRSDVFEVIAGLETVKFALGKLRHDAETREKLGSNAPTMAADALHPLIWEAASGRWDSGHYADAVQRAATFLSAHIRDLVSRHDVSDSQLMQEAFSSSAPTEGKPRLRWPGADDDQTVKSMRDGILNYSRGVFLAIRNPATHSTDDIERQEALEQLAALSMLARWVAHCEVMSV